jgi:hypothetical protein
MWVTAFFLSFACTSRLAIAAVVSSSTTIALATVLSADSARASPLLLVSTLTVWSLVPSPPALAPLHTVPTAVTVAAASRPCRPSNTAEEIPAPTKAGLAARPPRSTAVPASPQPLHAAWREGGLTPYWRAGTGELHPPPRRRPPGWAAAFDFSSSASRSVSMRSSHCFCTCGGRRFSRCLSD